MNRHFSKTGLGQRISRTGSDGVRVNCVLNYATGLPSVAVVQKGTSGLRYYVYTPGGWLRYGIDAVLRAGASNKTDNPWNPKANADPMGLKGISPEERQKRHELEVKRQLDKELEEERGQLPNLLDEFLEFFLGARPTEGS